MSQHADLRVEEAQTEVGTVTLDRTVSPSIVSYGAAPRVARLLTAFDWSCSRTLLQHDTGCCSS